MFKTPKINFKSVLGKSKFKAFSDVYSKDARNVDVKTDGRGYRINNPDGREFQLYYKDEEEFKDFATALAYNFNLMPNRNTIYIRISKVPPAIYIDW
jgi:hypothetical protein